MELILLDAKKTSNAVLHEKKSERNNRCRHGSWCNLLSFRIIYFLPFMLFH